MQSPSKNKFATTSLVLGLVAWSIYLLQWCFDLTLGLLLAATTAGSSAICASVLDVAPFIMWIVGIILGHVALSQVRHGGGAGRGRATWGLILNYAGLFFIVIITLAIVLLVAAGVGVGVFDKVFPFLQSK